VTSLCPGIPIPNRRPIGTYLLLMLWLFVGYVVCLRIAAGLAWSSAVWQGALCFLSTGPLLVGVILVIAGPKKLARLSRTLYRAITPFLGLSQYILPWLGWSVLIWWMNRPAFPWSDALGAGAVIAGFSYASGLALVIVLRPRAEDVALTEIEVAIEGLPKAFEGYRIMHLSDIHEGSRLSRAPAGERLERASGLSADLIVFTGDLARRAEALDRGGAALAALSSSDGIVAVLGNHDHWLGAKRVVDVLSRVGVRVLTNENECIERNGERLYIVGVEDASYVGRDDLPAALDGIPEKATAIIATHSPDLALKPLSGRASLILAGHTHGGQMVFPWVGPLYVPTRLGRRRMSGLIEVDERLLYINRGLGEVFPPMRLNCPPEIALITLRSNADFV